MQANSVSSVDDIAVVATSIHSLTPADLHTLYSNLHTFTTEEQEEILAAIEELERRDRVKRAQLSFIEFCKFIDPQYLVATHHKKLADLLEDIAFGVKDRIAVSIPPRHGKSQQASIYFPAWFLGKFPDKRIIMVSHTADLAVDFGRKVRNLIATPAYKEVFPNTTLSQDAKSAGRWNTNVGGEYFACGVGSSIAGRGADLLLVDDPHSEQDLIAGNFEQLEKAYQWFTGGARTRLMSGGRVAVIHCMTGDTNVLMSDNGTKELRNVRVGDTVASYTPEGIVGAKVLNWANQGLDRILTIKTTSGTIVRANERHPFLVNQDGVLTWTKVKDLKLGMKLMGVSRSSKSEEQYPTHIRKLEKNQNITIQKDTQINAVLMDVETKNTHLENVDIIITKTEEKQRLYQGQIIGGNGEGLNAKSNPAITMRGLKDYAKHTTINLNGTRDFTAEVRTRTGTPTLNTGMVFPLKSTTDYSNSKTVSALSVNSHPMKPIHPQIGKVSSELTTAMTESMSERYYVTPAISLSVKETQSKSYIKLLNTYVPTLEQIVEINFSGYEEVFDIQVEDTENFIANGLVSHNTRWHQDDLIGRLVKDGMKNEAADQYEVFEFPALLDIKKEEGDTVTKALWPEKFDIPTLLRTKASMPAFQWSAQYMQNPTAEESATIKREWWQEWKELDPPQCDYIIMCLDAAAETHNRADFTALTTWGVFTDERLTQNNSHIILLNCINIRLEFPELKDLAIKQYKEWNPDAFIVEKKNAGTQLYQELRRLGLPIQEFTPSRNTGDKIARLNAVADILRSGLVWYPVGRRWAEEVIEQCVAFPYGSHDDIVDTVSMALARFRQGGFITLPSDYKDEPVYFKSRRGGYY